MKYRLWALSVCLGFITVSATSNSARGETIVFDFPSGLDGWEPDWHIDSTTGTPGQVFHASERGFPDSGSLHFDMGNGLGDDGTLWIDRQFQIAASVPTRINVSFQLFNLARSDFNQFQVKAAVLPYEPQQQVDFATIGVTDSAAGWTPFSYETDVLSPSGTVWVGLGIRVAWETHRDYWIDHVEVSTTPVSEPSMPTYVSTLLMPIACIALLRSRQIETPRNLSPQD